MEYSWVEGYYRFASGHYSAALAGWLPRDYATLPAYLVPPPAGSTPKQRRQWQKAQTQNLAFSGVLPTKIKNSSVATAPGAVAINRPTSAVATGSGAATDARKAGTRGGRPWGSGHQHPRRRDLVGVPTGRCARGSRLGVAQSPRNAFEVVAMADALTQLAYPKL